MHEQSCFCRRFVSLQAVKRLCTINTTILSINVLLNIFVWFTRYLLLANEILSPLSPLLDSKILIPIEGKITQKKSRKYTCTIMSFFKLIF